jgi:hypothetical protein
MRRLLFVTTVMAGLAWSADWARTYGTGDDEVAYNISNCSDGGYVLAGTDGCYYLEVVKISSAGNYQWGAWGYGFQGFNYAQHVVQFSDGTYGGVGNSNNYDKGDRALQDMLAFKLNSSGAKVWGNELVDAGGSMCFAYSLCEAADGNMVMVGGSLADGMVLVKINYSTGAILWTKGYAGANGCWIVRMSDGGFLVTGSASSDMLLAKTDASGNLSWARRIGGTGSDNGWCGIPTSDGGYIMVGSSSSYGLGSTDMLLVKLDASLNIQWARAMGGSGQDEGWSVVQTPDGGYAVSGFTMSFGTGGDYIVLKFNSSGTLLWARATNGSDMDYGEGVVNASDGGLAMCGFSYSWPMGGGYMDMMVLKLESDGTSCLAGSVSPTVLTVTPTIVTWTQTPNSPSFSLDNRVAIGSTTENVNDPCPVPVQEEPAVSGGFQMRVVGQEIHLFAPRQALVSLDIYDASGRLVQALYDGSLSQGEHAFTPDLGASGIYIAMLRHDGGTQTAKLMR